MWWILTALVAVFITFIEISQDVNITHSSKRRIRVWFYIIIFLTISAFLSIFIYFLILENQLLSSLENWLKSICIGLSYLAIIRLKIFTIKVDEKDIPLGLDFLYEKIKQGLIYHVKGLIEQDVFDDAQAELDNYNKGDKALCERARVKLNFIFNKEKRLPEPSQSQEFLVTKKWLIQTVNTLNEPNISQEEKNTARLSLMIYIKFGMPM